MIATANADGSLKITPVDDLDVVITRTFDAPRRLVWDAHTKPDLLARWFGVFDGWTLDECDLDLRVGGAYRYVWRNLSRDHDTIIVGVFREITPPGRLVYTERFEAPFVSDGDAVNTAVFEERNGRTLLTLTAHVDSVEAREAMLASGMEVGLVPSYATLDELLRSMARPV
jgi:uncharacterized protein YndB with AHSA1/START domain